MARTTITFTMSLPPAMAEQLENTMAREHRTCSELVREALRRYFKENVEPGRDQSISSPGDRTLQRSS
jgi:metal-responsive CopG/Arc/MetJ family transcriptional regulator